MAKLFLTMVFADSPQVDYEKNRTNHIYGDGDPFDITNGEDALTINLELGALNYSANNGYWQEMKTSQVKDVLHIGGKSVMGGEVLLTAGVGSGTEELATTPFDQNIDYGDLTVEGLNQTLDTTGMAYGKSAVGY